MSMSRCKCGKIFDTDYELGIDTDGNCCCDDCSKPPVKHTISVILTPYNETIKRLENEKIKLLEALKEALNYIKGDYIDADGIEYRLENVIKEAEGSENE